MALLIQSVLWTAGWWVAVLSAGHGLIWPAFVAAALVIAPVAVVRRRSATPSVLPWPIVLLLIGGLGLVVDAALVLVGALRLPGVLPSSAGLVAPVMLALWLMLGAGLMLCLRVLQRRPLIAAVFGLLGAPAAYAGGFAAAALLPGSLDRTTSLIAVAAAYALAMPLAAWLARLGTPPAEPQNPGPRTT